MTPAAMRAALEMKQTSACRRRQVGAVIVCGGQPTIRAANGPCELLGYPLCPTCLRDDAGIATGTMHEICWGLHAEQHAIAEAARHGISTLGADLYVTLKPCSVCIRLIARAGISRVYYIDDFPDPRTVSLAALAGVGLVRVPDSVPD